MWLKRVKMVSVKNAPPSREAPSKPVAPKETNFV
jgi:hypothetical protein